MSDPTNRRAVPFRGGGFNPVPRRLLPWLVFVLLIAAWQAASSAGLLPDLLMPSPAAIVRALVELWVNGTLVEHITASLKRIIPGWIIGTAAGLGATELGAVVVRDGDVSGRRGVHVSGRGRRPRTRSRLSDAGVYVAAP